MSTRKNTRAASRGNRSTRKKPYRASTASSRGKTMRASLGPPIRQIPGAPQAVNFAYRIIQEAEYKEKHDHHIDNIAQVREAYGIMKLWESGKYVDDNSNMQALTAPILYGNSDYDMFSNSPKSTRRSPSTPGQKKLQKFKPLVERLVQRDPDAENVNPITGRRTNRTRKNTRRGLSYRREAGKYETLEELGKRLERAEEERRGLDEATKKYHEFAKKMRNTKKYKRNPERGEQLIQYWLQLGGPGIRRNARESRVHGITLEEVEKLVKGGKKSLFKKKRTRRRKKNKRRKSRKRKRKTKKKGGYIFETTYAAHNLLSDFTN